MGGVEGACEGVGGEGAVKTEQFSCATFHHAGDGKKEGRREGKRSQLRFVKSCRTTNLSKNISGNNHCECEPPTSYWNALTVTDTRGAFT